MTDQSEGGESVIRQRIYLYERKPEIRVALPLVVRVNEPDPYFPGAIMRAAESPSPPAPLVLAVYRYGGEANDIKGYYYYDFAGMEVA